MSRVDAQFFLLDVLEALDRFFQAGGPILYLIAATAFVMWFLIIERFCYYFGRYRQDASGVMARWQQRMEHGSWRARAVRRQLISEMHVRIEYNLAAIKVLIAICPLLGLLGTVTGMIDVFSGVAQSGGGDVKVMAGGVSRATIPTMAGMVAALSGVFANIYVIRKADWERERIAERLIAVIGARRDSNDTARAGPGNGHGETAQS